MRWRLGGCGRAFCISFANPLDTNTHSEIIEFDSCPEWDVENSMLHLMIRQRWIDSAGHFYCSFLANV